MTASGPPDEACPSPLSATPSVRRRLAAWVYEGVLLFGVVMLAGLVYGLLANQRHALQGAIGLQATLFAVIGAYFIYFWSRQGQTLAMRTWQVRLEGPDGRPPGLARAAARYLAAWMWFVPALATLRWAGLQGGGATIVVLASGVLGYAALALLRPDRQFWHDVLCGTRLVTARTQSPHRPTNYAPK